MIALLFIIMTIGRTPTLLTAPAPQVPIDEIFGAEEEI